MCFRNATVFSVGHVCPASAELSMSSGATRSFADVSLAALVPETEYGIGPKRSGSSAFTR